MYGVQHRHFYGGPNLQIFLINNNKYATFRVSVFLIYFGKKKSKKNHVKSIHHDNNSTNINTNIGLSNVTWIQIYIFFPL